MKLAIWMTVLGLIVFGSYPIFSKWYDANATKTLSYIAPVADAEETKDAIVGMTKKEGEDYILAELGTGCESKGVDEPTSAIVLDTNNAMSLGEYQWQIKSIQYYEKQLYGKAVSRTEAIEIAIDHEKATELTRDVVFKIPGALEKNWVNCTRLQALKVQVELLAHIK